MANCPSCNKFASLDFQDIDEPNLEVSHEYDEESKVHTYAVTGELRIVRSSSCCGNEMKEYTFEIDTTVDVPAADLEQNDEPAEATVQVDSVDQVEKGGGRYAKSYFGATVAFTLNVAGGVHGSWTDKVAASSMDELT